MDRFEHPVIAWPMIHWISRDRNWLRRIHGPLASSPINLFPVSCNQRAIPASLLSRIMRSDITRLLILILLMPVLCLGALGGSLFLAHCHDEQGMHRHPVTALYPVTSTVACHAHDPRHDHAGVHSSDLLSETGICEESCEVPGCVFVTVDNHKQLPTRGMDLRKLLTSVTVFVDVRFALPTSSEVLRQIGPPGGRRSSSPLNFFALSASDRLVRTSKALLI